MNLQQIQSSLIEPAAAALHNRLERLREARSYEELDIQLEEALALMQELVYRYRMIAPTEDTQPL